MSSHTTISPRTERAVAHDETLSWRNRLAQTDWTPWLIIGFAALLRFFLLGIKPPHFDEGINGWFVDQLVKNGFYRYDPTNYHGPLHFYVLFLSQTLFGRNLWALRLPVVLVSVTCVWLTLKFEPFVGRQASRWAAVAMAISPGFIFYGRYSIHEVWLVLFSMLFILGLLGLWRAGTPSYLWCAGMGLTGMILTKETYIIHLGCAAVAGLVCYLLNILLPVTESQGGLERSILRKGAKPVLQRFQLALVVHLISSGCLLTAAFLTSFSETFPRALTWRPYLMIIATVGFMSACFMPMQLVYGKSRERQIVSVIAGRWIMVFCCSICAQIGFFLPWPWNALFWLIAPIGVIGAFSIQTDRIFVVRYDIVDLVAVVATGAAAIVFFYSGTFFHWNGVAGLYESYAAWFATGNEGHGHEKPWYYWLKLIMRYEWPALIGLVLCLFAVWFKNVCLRYVAVYGVGVLIAYSIVNYKTPWCIVSVTWPLLFVFGAAASTGTMRKRIFYGAWGAVGGTILAIFLSYFFLPGSVREALSTPPNSYLSALVDLIVLTSSGDFSTRIGQTFFITLCVSTTLGGLAAAFVAAEKRLNWFSESVTRTIQNLAVYLALIGSFAIAISLNYVRCTTDTEPYVYVQTYNDISKLTRPLLALAKRSPIFYQLTGHIIRTSSYPLPWILGDFPHIGYYENKSLPQTLDADFLLIQSDRIDEVEAKLQNAYFTTPLTIRPYQDPSKLYFDAKKFKQFFPESSPNFIGKGPG